MARRQRAAWLPGPAAPAVLVVWREMARFWLPALVPLAVLVVVSGWAGWVLPAVLAGTVLLLWLSFVLHEAGHVFVLRLLAPTAAHAVDRPESGGPVPALFVVDRAGAGVHRPLLRSRWREAMVIVAGPVAPVLIWAAGVVGGFLVTGGLSAAAVTWTGIIAWGHPVAMLAPAGDTRALLGLRRRHQPRAH